jgi:hypothetical protein
MWKYEVSNTDHTLMQGVECVNRLLLGEAEQTIGIKYESTLDGRNAASHERSPAAGSGDPRKAGKGSPDAPNVTYPGQRSRATSAKAAATPLAASRAGHTDVGDKDEAHTSEEELGVTTPKSTTAGGAQ